MKIADAGRRAVAGSRKRERRCQHAIGIEPWVGLHESGEASDEQPCTHQEDAGEHDRGHDQARLQAVPSLSRCRARGRPLKCETWTTAIDCDQWDERKEDGRGDGDAAGERQDSEIDRDLLHSWKCLSNGRGHRTDKESRGQETQQSPGRGEDRSLREQELHQAGAA